MQLALCTCSSRMHTKVGPVHTDGFPVFEDADTVPFNLGVAEARPPMRSAFFKELVPGPADGGFKQGFACTTCTEHSTQATPWEP